MSNNKGWIGVDLDGTLAECDKWRGPLHIGKPVAAMVERLREVLAEGYEVRILTARVHPANVEGGRIVTKYIQNWLEEECGLPRLQVTCRKDFEMVELWDDRAVGVEPNTGRLLSPSRLGEGFE